MTRQGSNTAPLWLGGALLMPALADLGPIGLSLLAVTGGLIALIYLLAKYGSAEVRLPDARPQWLRSVATTSPWNLRCPYCHDELHAGNAAERCLDCDTYFHPDCAHDLSRCSTVGCGGRRGKPSGDPRIVVRRRAAARAARASPTEPGVQEAAPDPSLRSAPARAVGSRA
ncbi:MAG: hypothetical protein AB7N76_34210 [Planctomycetota bacterium]